MKKFYVTLIAFGFAINLFSQSSEIEVVKDYLVEQGYNASDVADLKVQSRSFSKSMNVDNLYVVQQHNGIPIRNAIGSFALRNGEVVSFQGVYVNDVDAKVNILTPVLSPEEAVVSAAQNLNLDRPVNMKMIGKKASDESVFLLSKSNISLDEIPVQLVYEVKEDKLVLCWDLSIHTKNGQNWFSVRIGAKDGSLQSQNDWIVHCAFDSHEHTKKASTRAFSILQKTTTTANMINNPVYNAFPIPFVESPNHGDRQMITGQEDATASPFGWHDTDGVAGAEFTTTRGNNVLASEDYDGNNQPGYSPDGGASLVFDFAFDPAGTVASYQDASITNLFYANNVIHDVWYQYGFDEESGNFQVNNYGRGGNEGDEVIADAIDGSGINNANFGTPPDGANPRMQMFLWNPQPDPEAEVFKINNNANLASGYATVDNNFSPGNVSAPALPDGITADLVLAVDDNATPDPNDICSALTNATELNGKIAVVRRGECNFTDKVARCQQAGAVAVLVVNNVEGDITMGGSNELISIPAVSINQADGEAIIAEMAVNTVNVTLSDAGLNIFAEDGSFDNGIVIHEYGHGISNRLAGGPAASGCLQNSEQMGEGWSDWFALMMTIEPGDTGADARGIGTFAVGQPTTGGGIRPFPYSTDMNINPVTYADVADAANFSQPHGIGSIWAAILWDMTWAFIERDGFDPDIYNGTGGNNLAMQLVIDGLKLQSCAPGFVSGRDGILAAAELTANSDANKCVIWDVFARRGVGYSADEGSTNNRSDQTEAFDLPPASELDCATLGVDDFNAGVFSIDPNPSNGIFNIRVSENIGDSKIAIFDMNGRVVYDKEVSLESSYQVHTNLRSGLYLLRIEAKDGSAITTSKILVK
ncbi:T9SS-dependent M36 family metallopeptidase [Aquimarina brevivitae]|uniref:Putative secreted protein (Por secretion system target) n=1 Tax=Aquimarina brevivitae TaxID=323412 RepID=A0A4Q7PFN6_9FLAO|nr:T9SS-dependent M36 family metallopeptidase [Aquimarina brevivitae]RZS98997.1 putative secreted protein (Por secretion system target) [Aquimarina brevivitae]